MPSGSPRAAVSHRWSGGMEGARTQTRLRPPTLGARPLSPALGAEITGIDLSRQVDESIFAQIRDAWHQNLVLLLRDQRLSEQDQVRFAEKFGPPAVIHTKQFVRNHPAVMLISNIREDGKPIGALPDGEMHFHTDQCHQERPAMASMLYALEGVRAATRCSPTATRPMRHFRPRSSGASKAARRAMPTTMTRQQQSAARASPRACLHTCIRWCAPIRRLVARRSTSTA